MPVRNLHWYSINAGISYPLDDRATEINDAGDVLPSNIVVDLHLRWPEIYGKFAFISSLSVTKTLVSLTIQGATSLDDDAGVFSPLAVLAVPLDSISKSRQIAVQGQVPGVGGWVVFGDGISETYQGRFSSPQQSILTSHAAKAYKALPIPSIQPLHAESKLTGLVRLRATSPLEVVSEQREIHGVQRDCIVLRLVESSGLDGVPAPSNYQAPSTFKLFSGPCAGRPESQTCGDPQPIEFVGAVGPDCDGVLTLRFTGCANLTRIDDICGAAIDCGLGLIDACLPAQVPNSDGLLPSEKTPVNISSPIDPLPPTPPTDSESDSVFVLGELPYMTCFDAGSPGYFGVASGSWVTGLDYDPYRPCDVDGFSFSSNTAAGRNIALWDGFDITTIGRQVSTDLKMHAGPAGVKHNAGIILNYRPSVSDDSLIVYYVAEVDYDTQEFRISRFNGTNFQLAVAYTIPGVQLEKWYNLVVHAVPGLGSNVSIVARLVSLEDAIIDITLGPLTVNNYAPGTGVFGFHANRALSSFSYFRLEVES